MIHEPNLVEMIIPTVMIPLTLIGVGISVVATFIASLFGVQLKAEGPKKLLEVLLKPRVLLTALILNAAGWGIFKGYLYWKNYPRLLITLQKKNTEYAQKSEKKYQDDLAEDNVFAAYAPSAKKSLGLQQAWKYESGSGVFSTPVVSANSVFFGNRGGFVHEVDLETGLLIRKFYIGSPVTPKITLWNNHLLVGEGVHDLHHARLYKFNLEDGKLSGTYQTKGHIEAQSVVGTFEGKTLAFVPSGADGLHAVNPETMEGVWKVNHGHIDSAVAVRDGFVFMGTGRERDDDKKNKCYAAAVDFKTGETKWKHEIPASSWIVPTLTKTDVCYMSGEVYFESGRGHILCFDQKSGKHTVAFNLDEPIAAIPVVVAGDLFVSTINGTLCSFNMDTKTQNWCHQGTVDGSAYAGPSYDTKRGLIVYPTFNEGVKVFEPKSGELLASWKPQQNEGDWVKTYASGNLAGDYWVFSDYVSTVRAVKASDVLSDVKRFVQK